MQSYSDVPKSSNRPQEGAADSITLITLNGRSNTYLTNCLKVHKDRTQTWDDHVKDRGLQSQGAHTNHYTMQRTVNNHVYD